MELFDLSLWNHQLPIGSILDGVSIDSREIKSKKTLFAALPGTITDGHKFVQAARDNGAKWALVSLDFQENMPGIHLIHVPSPLQALQEIAALYRKMFSTQVVMIAGSHGKTMVKDLLQKLLETAYRVKASPGSYNSQIGVPLSLFEIQKDTKIALIEAAFSLPGEAKRLADMVQADAAILTHCDKKHLATLETRSQVFLEYQQLAPGIGWLLGPEEVADISRHVWSAKESSLPYVHLLPAKNEYELQFPDKTSFKGSVSAGFSYICDLLNIAIKAAWLLGVKKEPILDVLASFKLMPMRTEIWKSPQGALIINEAPCSTSPSIHRMLRHQTAAEKSGRMHVIFGENSAHIGALGRSITSANAHAVHLIGEQFLPALKEELLRRGAKTEVFEYKNVHLALQQVENLLQSNDTLVVKLAEKEPMEMLYKAFTKSLLTNICTINFAAIETNLAVLRKRLGQDKRLMVMVKALAYGTDDLRMGKFLESCGIDLLGVSYVDEGISLRRQGIAQNIFVINAAPYEAEKIALWNLETAVSDLAFIEALEKTGAPLSVHLHIDTGMGRFGCRPEEALALAKRIHTSKTLKLEGAMTHFAAADDPAHDEFTLEQAAKFDAAIQSIEAAGIPLKWRHAANSSASIRFRFDQYNMVRLGLAVYGLYASSSVQETLDLRLALSLQTRLAGINHCQFGETVSYGRSYRVGRKVERIGVLPIGYFDGLHRNYSGKGHVMIRGQKAPMVGNICMDFMMIDITDIPEAEIGDPVLIFGEDEYGQYLSPEDLASKGQSIIHELITCLGPRIQRLFIYEEARTIR